MNNIIKFDDEKEQIQLIRENICPTATDSELKLFMHIAKRLKLDPLGRQICMVKRWDAKLGKDKMTVQTTIDGYRLIAERTKKYAPGREPEYVYNDKGSVICCKAFVKKQTEDGSWHEVAASAYYTEYAAKTKSGQITHFWASKPHFMLAKCAEALALRKAFPAELYGVYTKEEMEQADNPEDIEVLGEEKPSITSKDVESAIGENFELKTRIEKHYGCKIQELPAEKCEIIINHLKDKKAQGE